MSGEKTHWQQLFQATRSRNICW